jgi:hypothetical protein
MICSDGEGTMLKNPCHIFHGTTSLGWGDTAPKTVEMTKSTNNINIHIRNIDPAPTTRAAVEGLPDLTITVSARNGTIKHDHSMDESDTRIMTHISHNEFPQYQQNLHTTITVGRLFQNDGSQILIKEKDSGQFHAGEFLTNKILDEHDWSGTANDYLLRQDEYDLYYTVSIKNGVAIMVNITAAEWKQVNDPVAGL